MRGASISNRLQTEKVELLMLVQAIDMDREEYDESIEGERHIGMLLDVDAALRKYPNDPHLLRLRESIVEEIAGDVVENADHRIQRMACKRICEIEEGIN